MDEVDRKNVLKKMEHMYAQLIEVYTENDVYLEKYVDILEKLGKSVCAAKYRHKLYTLLCQLNKVHEAERLLKKFPDLQLDKRNKHKLNFLSFIQKNHILDRISLFFHKKHLKKGECLFQAGDEDKTLYVIENGEILIFGSEPPLHSPILLHRAKAGDVVGEYAAIYDKVRRTNAVAAKETTLISLTPSMVQDFIRKDEFFRVQLVQEAKLRRKSFILAKNSILAKLPVEERHYLAGRGKFFNAKANELIVESNHLIDRVMLIHKGSVNSVLTVKGSNYVVANYCSGDMLGCTEITQKEDVWREDLYAHTDLVGLCFPIHVIRDLVQAHAWLFEECKEKAVQDQTLMMESVKQLGLSYII